MEKACGYIQAGTVIQMSGWVGRSGSANYHPQVRALKVFTQHEPHWPWFLTGVTAPFATQSTASASCSIAILIDGAAVFRLRPLAIVAL